jgi:hypothetical protein
VGARGDHHEVVRPGRQHLVHGLVRQRGLVAGGVEATDPQPVADAGAEDPADDDEQTCEHQHEPVPSLLRETCAAGHLTSSRSRSSLRPRAGARAQESSRCSGARRQHR